MNFWKGMGQKKRLLFLFSMLTINMVNILIFYYLNKEFFDLLFDTYKIDDEMFLLNLQEPLFYLSLIVFIVNTVVLYLYVKRYSVMLKSNEKKKII
jgi:hypothetical protein